MFNPALSARSVHPAALSQAEIAAWERLSATHAHLATPFLSVHYARAVGAAGMDARVCVLSEGTQIRAFFPYQFADRWMRALGAAERIGGELCDAFGLIAAPDLHIAPEQLLHLASLHYVSFSHLGQEQLAHGLPGEQPRTALRVRIAPGTGAPLAGIASVGAAYIEESAAIRRRAESELGPLRFEFDALGARPDLAAELVAELIAQKRAVYRADGAADMLAAPVTQRVLARLASCRFDSCRGVLSRLYAGDRWLGAHFGIMGHGTLIWWLHAHDPALRRYDPERLLLHSLIDAARTEGFRILDRGEGDTPAKRAVHSDTYPLYRGEWHSGALAGRAAHALNRVRWRLRG